MVKSLQDNIKSYNSNFIKNYSLFLGGINATKSALEQYDPLKTGYNRIFFVTMPTFMETMFPKKTERMRHLLEYGFTSINGLGNVSLENETITGGYAGRSMDVPTVSKDDTQSITIGLYEFAGSPVREYMDLWISGIGDPYTGLGHYHGALDPEAKNEEGSTIKALSTYSQQYHIAEAIYVATDPTGRAEGIEYACLLSNMFPKQVKKDQFNYESGRHEIVTMDVEFSATKYESPQINQVAKALMTRYQTMKNYLDFKSEYNDAKINALHNQEIYNWPSDTNVTSGKAKSDTTFVTDYATTRTDSEITSPDR